MIGNEYNERWKQALPCVSLPLRNGQGMILMSFTVASGRNRYAQSPVLLPASLLAPATRAFQHPIKLKPPARKFEL